MYGKLSVRDRRCGDDDSNAPSTFGGYLGACSGTGACSVTMNSAQAVTASFVPPLRRCRFRSHRGLTFRHRPRTIARRIRIRRPRILAWIRNAHAAAFTIGQVLTPFTLTVVSTEVPPTNGDGICESGRTPGQDLDCRFGPSSHSRPSRTATGSCRSAIPMPTATAWCTRCSSRILARAGSLDVRGTRQLEHHVQQRHLCAARALHRQHPAAVLRSVGLRCAELALWHGLHHADADRESGVPTSPAIFCQFVFNITTFIDPPRRWTC